MVQTSMKSQLTIMVMIMHLLFMGHSQLNPQKKMYLNVADIQQGYSITQQIYDSKRQQQIEASRPKIQPTRKPTPQAAENANIKARSQLALNTHSMGFTNEASFSNADQRQIAITRNVQPTFVTTQALPTSGSPNQSIKQQKIVIEFEEGQGSSIEIKENKKYNVQEINSERIVSQNGEIRGVINKQADLFTPTIRNEPKQKKPSLQTQIPAPKPTPNSGGFGKIDIGPNIIASTEDLKKEREDGIIKIIFTALLAIGVILLVFGYQPHRAHDGQYLENRDDEENQLSTSRSSSVEMKQRTRPKENTNKK